MITLKIFLMQPETKPKIVTVLIIWKCDPVKCLHSTLPTHVKAVKPGATPSLSLKGH